jgi:type III restriction enzyme
LDVRGIDAGLETLREAANEIDRPAKMARLAQWCVDATSASAAVGGPARRVVYVDEEGCDRARPASFAALVAGFREYQPREG